MKTKTKQTLSRQEQSEIFLAVLHRVEDLNGRLDTASKVDDSNLYNTALARLTALKAGYSKLEINLPL